MKKETIEEFAERINPTIKKETLEEVFNIIDDKKCRYSTDENEFWNHYKIGVIDGLKWQQERSYSEEELNKIKEYANLSLQNLNGRESIEEIFDAGIDAGIEELLEQLKTK